MKEPVEMICKNCVYYIKVYLYNEGMCYRYPPTIFKIDGNYLSKRPIVNDWDFCGEFKERR